MDFQEQETLDPTVLRALRGLRFGSVEIVVHDGRVVQIERRERVRLDPAGDRPPDRRGRGNDPTPRTDRAPGGSERGASRGDGGMTFQTRRMAAGAWALVLSVAAGSLALADEKAQGTPPSLWTARPRRKRSEDRRRGEAGRHPEAHGGGRGLRPAVVERGLQAPAARLRAVRRPLLPERRGPARGRQLPPAARAADLRRHGGPPLRVPDHAGLRRRHDGAAGRLARREVLAEGAGAGRQVQVPGRPRATPVGHGDHVRRAGLPDGPRPQPRRRA